MAILANAIIFHMRLVRLYPEIHSIQQCKTEFGTVIKQNLLQCWQTILDINYWPIFQLACDIYKILPERDAQKIMQILDQMAAELERFGAADIQDLSGRMFQKLITDRKFLATFYTLPASATLLAELAVSRLNIDWRDPNKITKLKIADFACGTGALLGAAYHALSSRHRRTGGDDAMLHAKMMESVLTAADIMPSAVHLTASTLSGMHPDKTYQNTHIINMPYGENGNENGISIGSLDLLQKDETRSVFGSGRKALTARGVVVDDYQGVIVEVPHGSMNFVIMNPPFTRPTNHEATGVPIPSFAGFSTKEEEQKKMADRLKEIRRGLSNPAGHGNAGLASNFIDLAHIKLRPGGTLALVLPATFMQGKSWENACALLRKHYEDILVIGIATYGETERAFSADTSMAELLLVATKKKETEDEQSDIFVVNVTHRPRTQLEATVTAQMIERSRHDQNQDVGKILLTNTQQVGNFFRTKDWTGFAVKEDSLLILMHTLSQGNLLLPRMASSVSIPVCKLGELGVRGLLHRDINGRNSNGTPRGPFDLEALSPTPEYPILWGHNSNRERQLVVAPDQQGVPRTGLRKEAVKVWHDGVSRLHFNIDFGLNSQSLAACLTEKPALGGRSWPNFITNEKWEVPIVLWANSTLGLISSWWTGSRQQKGRSILTITLLPQLLTINPRDFSSEQLNLCEKIFSDFRDQHFLPANEAYQDKVRIALDHQILVTLLGLPDQVVDQMSILREQWCSEPSVHGGKATRPK